MALISHSWGFQRTERSLGAPSQQPRAPRPAGPFSAILCRRAALRGGGGASSARGAGPARLPPAARLSLPRAAAAPGRHWPGGPTWGARGRGRLPGERQGEERRRQRRSPAEPCGAGAEPEPERSRGGPSPALPSARYRHRGATRARQPRGSGGVLEPQEPRGQSVESPHEGAEGRLGGLGGGQGASAATRPVSPLEMRFFLYLFVLLPLSS